MITAPLAEVANINPRGEKVAADEVISFVGMAELDAEQATAVPLGPRTFGEVSKGYTVFRDGDLLAAKITPCWENGKVGQARLGRPIGVGSTEFHVIRPGPSLNHRYLLHFLRQPHVRAAGELRMTGSGGQRRVPKGFFEELQVPLLSPGEQRRIAAILDHADVLRAKRRQVLAYLDSLTQAIFDDMFWNTSHRSQLNEMGVDFISGKNVLGGDLDAHSENRVIKVSAISGGSFIPSESKPMPREYRPPEAHRLREGDILFGRASGSLDLLGATAVVDFDPKNLFLPDKVWRLTTSPNGPVDATYVLGILRSAAARAFIRHNASGAAGVRNIGKAKLLEYLAPLPSIDRQREYALRAENVQRHRVVSQAGLAAADELFASLQSRAFRGDL